ncbi:hypothetical protein PG993_007395 [Apiospora rasikravindrae]|uniref:Uncharacterized protein n=1 Tax=Apiospora rasikravindrae TaxID=990691 RepID=A0ABR1SXD4_9PEZI
MESSPTGLLDLPREIRDEIYSLLLCDFRPPKSTSTNSSGHALRYGGIKGLHLSILRVNRQIGNEAREIFYKTNRFVRVGVALEDQHWRNLLAGFASNYLPLPMVIQRRSTIKACKGFIMTYKISQPKPSEENLRRLEFVILHRDLHLLCLCLETATLKADAFREVTKHRITLHNPFGSTDESYPTIDQQQALLSPISKLNGFQNVLVQGVVGLSLASQIMTRIQVQPQINMDEIMKDLRHQEQLGHMYLEQNLLGKSCEAWANACKKMEFLGKSRNFHLIPLVVFLQSVDELQELFCEINHKLGTNMIRLMEANLDDPELVGDLASSALGGLSHALWRGAFPTARWKPHPVQKAGMLRQKARVYRLSGRFQKALKEIKQAGAYCPDDPDIREERFTVEWTLYWADFTV